jgi:predicted DCC family thiol-disulfide oxidoreductase YuxK
VSSRPPAGELTAYLDDGCDLCVGTARRLARLDRHGRVRFRPLADGAEAFPPQELLRELHVVDAEGQVFRGYDALVAIASRVDATAWVSPVLGWAPMRRLGRRCYRFVAGRRHTCDLRSRPVR